MELRDMLLSATISLRTEPDAVAGMAYHIVEIVFDDRDDAEACFEAVAAIPDTPPQ